MLTATERTCSAIYSEAAPWIHSIKTAKHNLEKGDTATTFPTRSQTAPQVIHDMLLQGGIFLPSYDQKKKKKICRGGNTYLNFFLGEKKNQQKSPSPAPRTANASEEMPATASGAVRQHGGRGTVAVPPFPAAGMTMREHPLHGTAGNCSQETEVLKLENRCQRK